MTLTILDERRRNQDVDRRQLGGAWPSHDLIFTTASGTAIHPRNFNRRFNQLAKMHRLDVEGRFGTHVGRRTVATTLLARGANLQAVSRFLGHSHPSITTDIYRTLFPEELKPLVLEFPTERAADHVRSR